jgi:hypothetical protein
MHWTYGNVDSARPSLAQRWHAMQPSVSHVCGRGRARARSMPRAPHPRARRAGKVSTARDSGSLDRRQVPFGRAIAIGSHDQHAHGTTRPGAAHVLAQWKVGKTEILIPGASAHTLFEPAEAGAARANPLQPCGAVLLVVRIGMFKLGCNC